MMDFFKRIPKAVRAKAERLRRRAFQKRRLAPEVSRLLRGKGWFGREFAYGPLMDRFSRRASVESAPSITLIMDCAVVSPNAVQAVKKMLDAAPCPVQLIVPWTDAAQSAKLRSLASVDICLRPWASVPVIRNIAAVFAQASILVFLSARLIPARDLLSRYLECFSHSDALAVRGSLEGFPQECHGGLGYLRMSGEMRSWPLDMPYNMAVRAEKFFAMGGFDEQFSLSASAMQYSLRLFARQGGLAGQYCLPAAKASKAQDVPAEPYGALYLRAYDILNAYYHNHLPEWYAVLETRAGQEYREGEA